MKKVERNPRDTKKVCLFFFFFDYAFVFFFLLLPSDPNLIRSPSHPFPSFASRFLADGSRGDSRLWTIPLNWANPDSINKGVGAAELFATETFTVTVPKSVRVCML